MSKELMCGGCGKMIDTTQINMYCDYCVTSFEDKKNRVGRKQVLKEINAILWEYKHGAVSLDIFIERLETKLVERMLEIEKAKLKEVEK